MTNYLQHGFVSLQSYLQTVERIDIYQFMKQSHHDSLQSFGVAYAKPVMKHSHGTNRKKMSRRESMLKDLPAAPMQELVPATSQLSYTKLELTDSLSHQPPIMTTQLSSRSTLATQSRRLLSLIRPDSWNVLSMADLADQQHTIVSRSTTVDDTIIEAVKPLSCIKRKHSFKQRTVRSVTLDNSTMTLEKVSIETGMETSDILTDIPEDSVEEEFSDVPVEKLRLDGSAQKKAERMPERPRHVESQSSQTTEDAEHMIQSMTAFKVSEIERRLPIQFREVLLTDMNSALTCGMLSGRIDIPASLSTKILVHNNTNVETMRSNTKDSLRKAIVWLVETHGWKVEIKVSCKASGHVRTVKYQLII